MREVSRKARKRRIRNLFFTSLSFIEENYTVIFLEKGGRARRDKRACPQAGPRSARAAADVIRRAV